MYTLISRARGLPTSHVEKYDNEKPSSEVYMYHTMSHVCGDVCGCVVACGGGFLEPIRVMVLVIYTVGVSLKFWGETIPNNSFVDLDDILYRATFDGFREDPSNANATLHDQALLCVTDLEDCCEEPHTVHGDWYYPDGNRIAFDTKCGGSGTFRRNRGPKEVRSGRQFYGSVRLFRRWSNPSGRGRFRCELPSAADPNINQTLYANIGKT